MPRQQHNASRNEDRWAYSLRDDPVNVSLNGLLFVDLSNNAVSDRGAAALAAFLPQDNWLQGAVCDDHARRRSWLRVARCAC